MPQTTPDPVPSPAPKESGGVGATPSAEAVQAPHDAARDWAALSGRWGQRHSAPIPEGLSGLGARGQEPVSPGPTLAEVREEVRRLTGWINDCARAARLPGGMELADVAAGIRAELERERKRANEAIAQLHDAQREFAALRGRVADGGEGMSPTDYQTAAGRTLPDLRSTRASLDAASIMDPRSVPLLYAAVGLAEECGEWLEDIHHGNFDGAMTEAGDVLWFCAAACTVLGVDLAEILDGAEPGEEPEWSEITLRACEIVGIAQKAAFYGKEIDVGMVRLYLAMIVSILAARHHLGNAMAANIDKLRKRWPDGFGVGG